MKPITIREDLPDGWRWSGGEVGHGPNPHKDDPMKGYGCLWFEHEDKPLSGTVEWDTGWDKMIVLVERTTGHDEHDDPITEDVGRWRYDDADALNEALPGVLEEVEG